MSDRESLQDYGAGPEPRHTHVWPCPHCAAIIPEGDIHVCSAMDGADASPRRIEEKWHFQATIVTNPAGDAAILLGVQDQEWLIRVEDAAAAGECLLQAAAYAAGMK